MFQVSTHLSHIIIFFFLRYSFDFYFIVVFRVISFNIFSSVLFSPHITFFFVLMFPSNFLLVLLFVFKFLNVYYLYIFIILLIFYLYVSNIMELFNRRRHHLRPRRSRDRLDMN